MILHNSSQDIKSQTASPATPLVRLAASCLRLSGSLCGLLLLATISSANADIPRKAPLSKYNKLWTNSPFTSKPPPEEAAPTVNPLVDYTLSGIAPVPGGYRITIISKKNPEEKEIIEPGRESKFSVVSVTRDPDKALGTSVVLASGSIQGTVAFEPELLTLKAPVVQRQPQPNPNQPPGANPQQDGQRGQRGQRQPRARIVPPPGQQQQGQNQQAQPNQQQGQPAIQGGGDRRRGEGRGQRGQGRGQGQERSQRRR